MSDTAPAGQGEKRGVVDEAWTPRFLDMAAVTAFDKKVREIAEALPRVTPGKESK